MSGFRRLAVTGSRHWKNRAQLAEWVDSLPGDTVIAHGAAPGVDSMIDFLVRTRHRAVVPFPVRRNLDGPWPAAGQRRNERMLTQFEPDLLVAFRADGKSNGTDGCIQIARRLGILVEQHEEER